MSRPERNPGGVDAGTGPIRMKTLGSGRVQGSFPRVENPGPASHKDVRISRHHDQVAGNGRRRDQAVDDRQLSPPAFGVPVIRPHVLDTSASTGRMRPSNRSRRFRSLHAWICSLRSPSGSFDTPFCSSPNVSTLRCVIGSRSSIQRTTFGSGFFRSRSESTQVSTRYLTGRSPGQDLPDPARFRDPLHTGDWTGKT